MDNRMFQYMVIVVVRFDGLHPGRFEKFLYWDRLHRSKMLATLADRSTGSTSCAVEQVLYS